MSKVRKIFVGSDHAGFDLKKGIIEKLNSDYFEIVDCGCYSNSVSVDYPDIARKVCSEIVANEAMAILFCGTGVGMSIAANKFSGVRAVCSTDFFSVKYARLHNNVNVLCLGGRVLGLGLAQILIDVFLNTDFEGGRHDVRLNKLNKI